MAGPSKPKSVLAILFALLLGGGAFAFGAFSLYKVAQIAGGPVIEGRATAWDTSRSRGRVRYKVTYTFARDGATYTGTAVIPQDVHDATRGGAPLVVRTAAANPEWHTPDAALPTMRNGALIALGTGGVLLALVFGTTVLPRLGKRPPAPTSNIPNDPAPGSP